jgi:hypothetical protein
MNRVLKLIGLLALGAVILVLFALLSLRVAGPFLAERGITLNGESCSYRRGRPEGAEWVKAVRSDHFPWAWECTYRLEDGTFITIR